MADDTKTPVTDRATTELAALADKLRGRVDLFGKSLAALATVGTGAVGLAKVGDLAPIESGEWPLVFLVGGSLVVAAIGAIIIAVNLMKVSQPVVLDEDLGTSGLTGGERQDVESIYRSSARRFGFTSLVGLAERERSLRKAAFRATTDDERARRTALADEAKAEIQLAIARGRLAVVRRQAVRAVSGPLAFCCYVAVVVGLLVFGIAADVVGSDRTDAVATAKACAEAREAGATAEDLKGSVCHVPDASEQSEEEGEDASLTVAEARAELVGSLTEVLKTCAALADEDSTTQDRPLTEDDCGRIAAAIRALARE